MTACAFTLNQGTGIARSRLRRLGPRVDPLPILKKSAEFAELYIQSIPPQSRLPSAGRLPTALPS